MKKRIRQLVISVAQPHLGTGVKNHLTLRASEEGPEIEIVAGTGYDHLILLNKRHARLISKWFNSYFPKKKLRKRK